MPSATLFIVSAPSGAGKTSLVKALVETTARLVLSISHTTRARRPGEQPGLDYHFVDPPAFEAMQAAGEFLECARVFDHHYGTSRQSVVEQLGRGNDVILEIDWQGAQQIREQLPRSCSLFIVPPSREALAARLRDRGQDSEAIIERRMQQAITEMRHYDEFDYLIINDEFDAALSQLQMLIQGQRLATARQAERHRALLLNLLGS